MNFSAKSKSWVHDSSGDDPLYTLAIHPFFFGSLQLPFMP